MAYLLISVGVEKKYYIAWIFEKQADNVTNAKYRLTLPRTKKVPHCFPMGFIKILGHTDKTFCLSSVLSNVSLINFTNVSIHNFKFRINVIV